MIRRRNIAGDNRMTGLTLSVLRFRLVGFRLDILGLRYPIEISSEVVLDLLFFPELVKVTASLCLLSFLRELAVSEVNAYGSRRD